MQPVQIILLVMIAVGIIFIVASIILSVREKNSDQDISARKQELKEEMDQIYAEHARTAQEQLDESTKQALDAYVEEAKRELEVLMNETKEYVKQLSAAAQAQMESCVTQTQEETDSIAKEMKARLKEISAEEDEKIRQNFADVREEITEHQKEASMAYTMISEKQNQLIESIEQEQSKTKKLAETVAQISVDASFLQEELLSAAREAVPEITQIQPETEDAADPEGAEEAKAGTAQAENTAEIETAEAVNTEREEAVLTEAAGTKEAVDTEAEMTEAADVEESVEGVMEAEVTVAEEKKEKEKKAADIVLTEEEELQAEREFSETIEFDVVQPKKAAGESGNLELTKPIDRGEIREALQAQENQTAEAVSDGQKRTMENPTAAENAASGREEINIDEVIVADVEEFDSFATETVKAAVQEVLSEEESLLDYSETEWDTEAALKDTEREEMTGTAQAEADEAAQTEADEAAQAEADEAAQPDKAGEAAQPDEAAQAESHGIKEKHHGRKTSVVWNLSRKDTAPAPEEPEEETIPEDMVLEDEPNKMLHAVRSSGTVSTEADLEMRKKVLNMYDRGSSSMEIAEKLGLGIGEVRMIIDLYSRRER